MGIDLITFCTFWCYTNTDRIFTINAILVNLW